MSTEHVDNGLSSECITLTRSLGRFARQHSEPACPRPRPHSPTKFFLDFFCFYFCFALWRPQQTWRSLIFLLDNQSSIVSSVGEVFTYYDQFRRSVCALMVYFIHRHTTFGQVDRSITSDYQHTRSRQNTAPPPLPQCQNVHPNLSQSLQTITSIPRLYAYVYIYGPDPNMFPCSVTSAQRGYFPVVHVLRKTIHRGEGITCDGVFVHLDLTKCARVVTIAWRPRFSKSLVVNYFWRVLGLINKIWLDNSVPWISNLGKKAVFLEIVHPPEIAGRKSLRIITTTTSQWESNTEPARKFDPIALFCVVWE